MSRALGGLRIANPDDADSIPSTDGPDPYQYQPDQSRPRTGEPASFHQQAPIPMPQPTYDTEVQPPRQDPVSFHQQSPMPLPQPTYDTESQPPRQDPSLRQPHTYESAAAILKNAQDNLNARGIPTSTTSASPGEQYTQPTQQQYPPYQPANGNRMSSGRPVPGQVPTPNAEVDRQVGQYNNLRTEPSRSSMYGAAAKVDSASDLLGSQVPSREPSRSQRTARPAPGPPPTGPPGNGPSGALPPRRSSKGMGTGYASIPGVPFAPPSSNSNYGADVPPLASSEEWKDRGAAVSLRREVDADGRTVIRSVKKGVRDFSFGRILGEGSYSTVYLATDRQTLREYAIKVLARGGTSGP